MLRDICPESRKTILVDDALSHDRPPSWVLKAAQVELYEGLRYEGTGINGELLKEIEEVILS